MDSSRIVWLHYGNPKPRWDDNVLKHIRKIAPEADIVPLDASSATFETARAAIHHTHDGNFESSQASSGDPKSKRAVVVNRVSDARAPSLAKFVTTLLAFFEDVLKIDVVNGSKAWRIGMSKSLQGEILEGVCGLEHPRTNVLRSSVKETNGEGTKLSGKEVLQFMSRSSDLDYPILVEPNSGGFGAGMRAISSETDLWNSEGVFEEFHSNDGVFLLQKMHADATFFRVFHIGGKVTCAVQVVKDAEADVASFNSCTCTGKVRLVPVHPISKDVCDEVESIAAACGSDLGSVEFLVAGAASNHSTAHLPSEGATRRLYFDVNMLTTFPTPTDIGNDPSIGDPELAVAQYIVDRMQNSTPVTT